MSNTFPLKVQKFVFRGLSCYKQAGINAGSTVWKKRKTEMKVTSQPERTYLINEVATRVGLSQKRIREYEKGGLLRPDREPRTNNRRYTETDIQQILRVKELIHAHGFTLACLKYFLASAPCWVIFNCKKKQTCDLCLNQEIPCYEMVQQTNGDDTNGKCRKCPVYLNRKTQPMTLLNKA